MSAIRSLSPSALLHDFQQPSFSLQDTPDYSAITQKFQEVMSSICSDLAKEPFLSLIDSYIRPLDAVDLQEFHKACKSGTIDRVRSLLMADSRVAFPRDEAGYSALDLAILYDRTEVARLLIRTLSVKTLNTEPSLAPQQTALRFASTQGRTEIVQSLLEKGVAADCAALNAAIFWWHQKTAILLIDWLSVAELNQQDENGNTVLHKACYHKSYRNNIGQVIEHLQKKGVDTTLRNRDGKRADEMPPRLNEHE